MTDAPDVLAWVPVSWAKPVAEKIVAETRAYEDRNLKVIEKRVEEEHERLAHSFWARVFNLPMQYWRVELTKDMARNSRSLYRSFSAKLDEVFGGPHDYRDVADAEEVLAACAEADDGRVLLSGEVIRMLRAVNNRKG